MSPELALYIQGLGAIGATVIFAGAGLFAVLCLLGIIADIFETISK